MFQSQLFQGDTILEAIANNQDRINRSRNTPGNAVLRVQIALQFWDPDCLPQFGADSQYGDETAAAVARFKIEELGVPPAEVIDDVGPRTVIRLDEIAFANETPPAPPPSLFVRQDIWSLQSGGAWHPIVLAYAQAIQVMQSRPASDPTSWAFQSAIHGTYTQPPQASWNSCQHSSWFFLPWHRMYLWYFERIVRAAVPGGAPADFALPYWDYEKVSPADTLPLPFRDPAFAFLPDGSPNPLQLGPGMRRQAIANGSPIDRSRVSSVTAMGMLRFVDPPGVGFGGGDMRRNHPIGGGSFGAVEANPHNLVHSAIGGTSPGGICAGALMNDGNCAPLDPIFWLHHANIDRLWNRWLANGGGRANPSDVAWQTESFTFHNENGIAETIAVSQVLDTAAQLNYVYDDVPAFVVPSAVQVGVAVAPPEFVGATEQTLELVGSAVSLPIAVGFVPQALLDGTARVVLRVEDIQAETDPGIGYAVYVNLPEDADPATREERLVGEFSLFGIQQVNDPDSEVTGLTYDFDLTALVRTLISFGQWDPTSVNVTVEPFDLVVSGGDERASLFAQLPVVRIGRVSLFVG